MNTENAPENNVPERKTADDAVLDAFSRSFDGDEEFRKRWQATVNAANKRKEDRKAAEEARLRAEAEKKARLEHAAAPRVSDETKPGVPLDIQKLAAMASLKKAARENLNGSSAENNEPEKVCATEAESYEPEPEDFVYNDTAAEEALKRFGGVRSDVVKDSTVRDRTVKMKIGQRMGFFVKTRFSKNSIKAFAARNFPVKGDDGAEIVRKCIRIVSCIALVCALGFLGNYFVDYCHRISDTNAFESEMDKLSNIDESDLADAWAQIRAQYPDVEFPEGMNIKYSKLYAMNQHFVGWLKIDNTRINTALLQSDDNSYHLKHNIYDEYTRFGNPFVHYRCSMGNGGFSKNTIIFGHNANDKLMFHDLINYMTVEGYLKSPIVTLDTLYGQTKWKVFAVVLTNSHPSEDNGYVWSYLYPEFNSTAHFNQVMREIDARTIIHTGVDVKEDDNIMTLYTCCTYVLESGRLAVFARQLRDGESEEIDAARVYYNQNARYPQTWYDRKGKTNPYADPSVTTTTQVKTTDAAEEKTTAGTHSEATTESNEPVTEAPEEQPATTPAEPPATEVATEVTAVQETPSETPAAEAPASET